LAWTYIHPDITGGNPMNIHPPYYTELVWREFHGDPELTPAERRELELHLLICPQCNYEYAQLLLPDEPQKATQRLQAMENALTAELVTPYLRDLARAVRSGRPLTGFQHMVWQFVCRDREALGRYRLLEADEWLNASG
jgi:hypothetical protein